MQLPFRGVSKALTADALASAASHIGTGTLELWAVISVETSGCGFLPDRRPQVLFERHFFHRLTGGRFDDGDISDPAAGGYGPPGARQFDRLSRALALDRTAALMSASWGIGQVMGEYHQAAGFADVDSMVNAMADSEGAQIESMSRFIGNSKPLAAALRTHDWTSFARRYNGPDYATNGYDARLRAAFESGKIPDLRLRAAQLYLTFLGFKTGGIDGNAGRATHSAIAAFESAHGMPLTGDVTDDLIAALEAAMKTPIA